MKFMRTFKLFVQENYTSGDAVIEIDFPLTIDFQIKKDTLASMSTGHFWIYNLSEKTRNKLFHDRIDTSVPHRQSIQFQAGYVNEPSLPIIFKGNVMWAYSYRRGPDWITEIDAFDGGTGIINGQASITLPAPWNIKDAITKLCKTLPFTSLGAIGNLSLPPQPDRGVTFSGNTWDIITGLAEDQGAQAFIDDEKVYVMNDNEYLSGNTVQVYTIDSDTGILETPQRSQTLLDVSLIFEPTIKVNNFAKIISQEPIYNGTYIIKGFSHRGTISAAVCKDAITRVSVFAGTEPLTAVAEAA